MNIPSSRFHIILTAGHNLIDGRGVFSQKLDILAPGLAEKVIQVDPNDVFVSEVYRFSRSKGDVGSDYGMVRLPKVAGDDRGFGFCLKLGCDDLRDRDMIVNGYKVDTKAGEPVMSTGRCLYSAADHLEYDILTEKGLSGSPIFTAYQGHEAAVAIQ